MKAHLSAVELLALALPGLPASEKGLRLRADREAWPFVEVPGKGGRTGTRREYLVAELPAPIRAAIQSQAIETAVSEITSTVAAHATALTPAGDASLPMKSPAVPFSEADLTDAQRLERDARTGVLAALRHLQAATQCTQEAAITTLLTSARAGRLDEVTDRLLRLSRDSRGRTGDGYPSPRTLKRWLGARDLVPRVARADMSVPAWAGAFLAEFRRPEKPSVEAAYRAACAAWGAEAERPSIHQVRRFLTKLGNVTRENGRMGARELKNIQPFVRRDFSHLEPNDVWSADGHTFDAEVQHPLHGRPFRPEITVFVDIATRRTVGWSCDLAESGIAVADALRWGVERSGVPALIYVDNGSGYRNAAMSDEAVGLVGRIGSTMTHSLPYNSQARGVIERLHQTLWVEGAKDLPGYIGAAMDREARLAQFKLSRKAIKGGGAMPLMPWELFVAWVQERVDWYNDRAHRSLGNTSPNLAWRAFEAKGWTAHMLDAALLETLFRPRIARTVARGELVLFNNRYFSRDLTEFHGEQVHVAYDIHDAGKVWAYWPDGRLICTAEVDGNRKHYFPVPVIEQARQTRAKGHLARVETKRDEILAELNGTAAIPALESAPLVIGGRIVDPAAALAARRDAIEHAAEVQATPAPRKEPTPPQPDTTPRSSRTTAENYAEWLDIDRRINALEEVTDAEARWHRTYTTSAQYKAHVKKLTARAGARAA